MLKKLLFVGHTGHQKTKSSDFIQEIFRQEYEVTTLYLHPSAVSVEDVWSVHKGESYDVLVIWQVMPNLSRMQHYISWNHGLFFPMYDNVVFSDGLDQKVWKDYSSMRIINFSRCFHEELLSWGFDTKYIQYFPQPKLVDNWGSEDALFFWQRQSDLNVGTLAVVARNLPISRIHIHKALDPEHHFTEPKVFGPETERFYTECECTESVWFDRKSDMEDILKDCALYMAPRRLEGIGMSFLDAMAMGRCIIAPNLPTMNEYITDGQTGLLYDWDDASLTHCAFSVKADAVQIRAIQRHTLAYIAEGRKRWDAEKNIILRWAAETLSCNEDLLKRCAINYGWDRKFNYKFSRELKEIRRLLFRGEWKQLRRYLKVLFHPKFSTKYYMERYPDVAQSGVSAAKHFMLNGWKEGRNPSESFPMLYYLECHPEAIEKEICPLLYV